MSQSVVTVRLNGQPYQMGCDPGQEAHIEALAAGVDAILQQLAQSVGQIGEARMLAMASLILADQTSQSGSPLPPAAVQMADNEALAERIEAAAERIKMLASQLAKA